MEKVRIDKYLWAIRVFKTRSLAAEACYKGKVTIREQDVKSSYAVKIGDRITIKIHSDYSRIIEVVELLDKRGSAEAVKPYFIDHSPPYIKKQQEPSAFYSPPVREKGSGRPTKKERRNLDDTGMY